MKEQTDLTVVGGGITGLVAAYIAAKSGKRVRIIEASDSFGGLLKTFEIGGTELECFYHHFFLHDKELNWLIEDLNLSDRILAKETKMGIYSKGELHDFSGLKDLLFFRPLSLLSKLRFIACTLYLGLFSNWRKKEHIAAFDWFKRYAGDQVLEYIWKPLLAVKFGKYAKEVPLSWMIGRIRQRFKSREKGQEKLLYLDGSHALLLKTLLAKLKALNVELILNTKIDQVLIENNAILGVQSNSELYLSQKTLFTIPADTFEFLLKNYLPENEQEPIRYFGAVCVILELEKSLSPYYWLNIADEKFPFGGIIEHSQFISPATYQNKHIVYLSKYFALDEAIADLSNSEIEHLLIDPLVRIFPGFNPNQIRNTFTFRSRNAATVCDLNFSKKIPSVKSSISNLYQCNMAHVYPDERSVNNSIRIASNACKTMGLNTDHIPSGISLSGSIGF